MSGNNNIRHDLRPLKMNRFMTLAPKVSAAVMLSWAWSEEGGLGGLSPVHRDNESPMPFYLRKPWTYRWVRDAVQLGLLQWPGPWWKVHCSRSNANYKHEKPVETNFIHTKQRLDQLRALVVAPPMTWSTIQRKTALLECETLKRKLKNQKKTIEVL